MQLRRRLVECITTLLSMLARSRAAAPDTACSVCVILRRTIPGPPHYVTRHPVRDLALHRECFEPDAEMRSFAQATSSCCPIAIMPHDIPRDVQMSRKKASQAQPEVYALRCVLQYAYECPVIKREYSKRQWDARTATGSQSGA